MSDNITKKCKRRRELQPTRSLLIHLQLGQVQVHMWSFYLEELSVLQGAASAVQHQTGFFSVTSGISNDDHVLTAQLLADSHQHLSFWILSWFSLKENRLRYCCHSSTDSSNLSAPPLAMITWHIWIQINTWYNICIQRETSIRPHTHSRGQTRLMWSDPALETLQISNNMKEVRGQRQEMQC